MKTIFTLPGNLVHVPVKIEIIHGRQVFFTLLVSLLIVLFMGCTDSAKIALETTDNAKGLAAITNINDPEILAKISLEAKTTEIRLSAVEKLTDQTLLATIALNADENDICLAAAKKVMDQSLLYKIVFESQNSDVCVAAIERITSPDALANIVFSFDSLISLRISTELQADSNSLVPLYFYGMSSKVFEASIIKMKEISETTGMQNENVDMRVKEIYQLISAFDNIPEYYRYDKMSDIMPAFAVLNSPKVINELGEFIAINSKWKTVSETYHGEYKGTMPGEWIQCSIQLSKLTNPLVHSWGSDFPMYTTTLNFLPAYVNYLDIFGSVLNKLPQEILEKIALDASDLEVQCDAIKLLTNKSFLAKLAKISGNSFASIAARERLTALNKSGKK